MTIVCIKRGNVLNAPETCIVHQCNCTTRLPHGLSNAIATRYPECDVYSRRGGTTRNIASQPDTPGTIKVFATKDRSKQIICFLAQWAPGRPHRYSHIYPPPPSEDTLLQRTVWFQQCLRALELRVGQTTVAIPHKIGCGLAGGLWDDYEKMLQESSVNFIVYCYDPKVDT